MTGFDTPVFVRWVETTLFYRGEGTQLNIAEAVGFIEEDNKHMLKLAMCQSRLPIDNTVAQTYVSVGIPKGSIVSISEMKMEADEQPMNPWETVAGNEALQRFREAGAEAASAPIFADVRGVLDTAPHDSLASILKNIPDGDWCGQAIDLYGQDVTGGVVSPTADYEQAKQEAYERGWRT